MGLVTIFDKAASGEKSRTLKLEIRADKVSLRELIRQRIREEVEDFNREQSDVFCGLIQPMQTAEKVRNQEMSEGKKPAHSKPTRLRNSCHWRWMTMRQP